MKLNQVSKEFGVSCNGGKRRRDQATCAVLHQTGGLTARSAASYLSTRPDGSVHAIVDNTEGYATAPISLITCGVRDVNSWTWHIEQAGPFTRNRKSWMRHYLRTIRRAAYHMARFLVAQGIPPRYLSTKDFNEGRRYGWTTHRQLSESDISSSTHTDPTNYPRRRFSLFLRYYIWQFKRGGGVPHLEVVAR